jgi:hypothetical protein
LYFPSQWVPACESVLITGQTTMPIVLFRLLSTPSN